MPLATGTRLGPYEIVAPLGSGGMGEVYRAKDTRLDRVVAVKVMPPHVAASPELRERFDREARTISSLNHPHICTLYDVGHQGPSTGSAQVVDYLVMEFLEGQTLAERLVKGALPIDQVLRYATEIVDALDQAHRQGIVHRDLKPGNIMLTKAGAKLLDFGLAKLQQAVPEAAGVTMMATGAANLTAQGSILGTFQYMAPEQLEGKEADARTDIFAFGAVAYEMATGRRAFEGKSQASLISSIMSGDPPAMTTLQPLTPPGLERIVRKCLAKDPDDRWQSARDLASELRWIAETSSPASVTTGLAETARLRMPSTRRERMWMGVAAAAFVVAAIAVALPYFKREPPGIGVVRFSIPAIERARAAGAPRVSPNGRRLSTVGLGPTGTGNILTLASIDSLAGTGVPGTEGSTFSSWSADSRYVAFFQGGKLKKVEFGASVSQTLCDAPSGVGSTWNRDGVIVFAASTAGGLSRVAQSGGVPTILTTLDPARQEISHRFPWFLPDGDHFLYLVRSTDSAKTGIYVASLGNPNTARFIVRTDYDAAYASGYLLFVRERTLMAQAFDLKRLQITGEAAPLVEQIETTSATGRAGFSVSDNGLLVTRIGATTTQLAWVDRSGRPLETLGPLEAYRNPALSPDGKRVIVERTDPQSGTFDLWLRDLTRGTLSRFTFDPADDMYPVWSPDSRRVVFYSARQPRGLYLKDVSGVGAEELFFKADGLQPENWTADGQWLAYEAAGPQTGLDVWSLPMTGERKPSAFLQTPFTEMQALISPSGKWIAYCSNESGRSEVYVQSFPRAGSKAQISTAGGSQPRWRPDGKELFYLSSTLRLMVIAVRADTTFEAGEPTELFQLRLPTSPLNLRNAYAVGAGGQRFLINVLPEQATASLVATLNWTEALKR